LAYLAKEKKVNPLEFRNKYTEWSGIRLLFDGAVGYNEKKACGQYIDGIGCSVHIARPLACRLFPLGRQIQNGETAYIHQGKVFPCLEGCSEVLNLPYCSVTEYLIEQHTEKWEISQNGYLEVVQILADIAFELLLDSGLAEWGDKETLQQWRIMATESPDQLAKRFGTDWLNYLTIPNLDEYIQQPHVFCEQHVIILQQLLQILVENAQTHKDLHEASIIVMAMTLFLSHAVGADSQLLANHWIEIAKNNGAQE
jgi:Fe-S-cluster containining protein